MQLTHTVDIEAPRDAVFARLADVDHWERAALRRGTDAQRVESPSGSLQGMSWRATYNFRGKRRDVTITLDKVDPGQSMNILAVGAALEATTVVDLAEMAPRRTRVTVSVDLSARTLTARLFLQSLRLSQGRVKQKFEKQIVTLAQDVESRLSQTPSRS
jgi:carbon monoxide dehydrogenase subunit G